MKRLFFALLMLGYSAFAVAQTSAPAAPAPAAPQKESFEPDTVLLAELAASVDAAKAKPGDVITAKLHGDTWGATQNLLPDGSTLIGHVIEAHPRGKQYPQSKLSISFDTARMKDGTEMPLNLVIKRVDVPATAPMVTPPFPDPLDPMRPVHSGIGGPHSWPIRGPLSPPISGLPPGAGASGLSDVELASTKQSSRSFTVLTSSRREVRLKKHDLVILSIVSPEDQPPK